MATKNTINCDTTGIVSYDGAGTFTGTTTTDHSILVGNSSGTISSVGPGTTNTVMLGNTGSDPSFGTVPAGALPGSGQITLSNGNNITVTGSPVSLGSAATIAVSGTTNHAVQVGNSSGSLTSVSPSATSGVPVISQGSSADPVFGTAVVAGGGTGAVSLTGVLTGNGTSAFTASSVTQYGTVVAGTSNSVSSIAPSATSGIPYISQGSSSNPTFGTAVVAGGGTGAVTLTGVLTGNGTGAVTANAVTQYGVVVGGASNAVASTAVGSAGQVLQSSGAGVNPAYSTATYPSTATGTGKILIANGTNWVASTPTYPNTSGTAGKVVISDGTNNVYSTPTFPNASATSGKIIKSDGTNWTASTETYAAPSTSGNILTSDGTNWTSAAPASTTYISGSLTGVGNANPLDSTTYYFGCGQTFIASTTSASCQNRFYANTSYTLNKVYGVIRVAGTLGTTENCTLFIRKNDTTNTNISTALQLNAIEVTFNATSLGIALVAGDFIVFGFTGPAWSTNPTNVSISVTFSN